MSKKRVTRSAPIAQKEQTFAVPILVTMRSINNTFRTVERDTDAHKDLISYGWVEVE